MQKTEYNIKLFSSARSGRVKKVVLAPPILIYALFAVGILFQIPVGYILTNISLTLGILINQIGILLIPVLIAIRIFELTVDKVLPFKKVNYSQIIIAVVMMCSLAVLTDYLIFVTELIVPVSSPLAETYKKIMHISGAGSFIHKFVILCIIPSFCEEMFFRGFCQTGLDRHYGRVGGIFIVAAMFAVAHLSPWYLHIYFILGIFLSWLFITSGTLWIPIICHMVNNLWTFVMYNIGWTLPARGRFGLVDLPIIFIALVILAVMIVLWRRK